MPTTSRPHREWAQAAREAMARYGAGRTYVNFTGEAGDDTVKAAYSPGHVPTPPAAQEPVRPFEPVPLQPERHAVGDELTSVTGDWPAARTAKRALGAAIQLTSSRSGSCTVPRRTRQFRPPEMLSPPTPNCRKDMT